MNFLYKYKKFSFIFLVTTLSVLLYMEVECESSICNDHYICEPEETVVKTGKNNNESVDLEYPDIECKLHRNICNAHGRTYCYNNSLFTQATKCHFLMSMGMYYDFSGKAFDAHGESVDLSLLGTDGKKICLRDIFLLSRLSEQGKLGLYSGAPPLNPKFGHQSSEQYLSLLAPLVINASIEYQEFGCDITGMYCINLCQSLAGFFGLQLPVKFKKIRVDLSLCNGKLYQVGYVANAIARETTITQFFKDFSDIEDFFIRAVLQPKELQYLPMQCKLGIGDFALFAIFDVKSFLSYVDNMQGGITFILPTAQKTSAKVLHEIELGNGGGFLLDVFGNIFFCTPSSYINPTVQAGVELGINHYSSMQRIPQTKVQASKGLLRENPMLLVPVFREYYTESFAEIDSTVPLFADAATEVSMRRGNKLFVGCGNYCYDLFGFCSRLGIFYDYLRTGKTKFYKLDASYKTSAITDFSDSHAHRFGWNFTFGSSNGFECSFGSQHVFAGKNTQKLNELFLSLVAVF